MKILFIILGAIMAIFGITLISTPVATFLEAGYFFAILLMVFGILNTINCITNKKFNLNLVYAILTAVLGILLVAVPGFMAFADGFLIYLMAIWFILQGVVCIYTAVQLKKKKEKGWGSQMFFGVLDIILGVYSVFHPLVLAYTLGLLVGVYFIVSGIQTIIAAFQFNKA